MRFYKGCTDCLISRVEYESRLCIDDTARIQKIVGACRDLLRCIAADPVPAPVIASRVHRLAYRMIGDADPYRSLKEANNEDAAAVSLAVRGDLSTFRDLALAAVIGNTLDYGSKAHTVTDNFVEFFRREFAAGLTVDDTGAMEGLTDRVVYLADNCGEIVFDALLVDYLKEHGSHVTFAVRGAPILNDATIEDAVALGLDRRADVLAATTDGIAELGLNRELAPPPLTDALDRATLIIAKGMANYESLSDCRDLPPVAHLMSVKCGPIGADIGISVGSRVALLRE
ncbi:MULTISPECIES: ARMT1-like domain-containing protein [unclassified Methanoculleus]|uniref:damage-control phosphatase ARMT1 family protein n=1 Tax=unclassified Methanoculleus TaxID=2619537 RepID=UPI0025F2D0B0|nr:MULTISPECIES: ARMT1-like domain-containing protein [unclassified Methanoculleus]MCK9318720.1 ARMT1-like domain-containing protein [Methanoculleus sp.]MDD2254215.1 ARMT1-like domain-containing protein [Methanoculleus sp.]MDD2786817.1 ARMT1-like domain-containing protein [Methanoculleus sp.]MDD3217276.1 ARMT1-like domain-containing protein [Methanoculleus sp.]MDD4314192.1 ARMT1-like domain-containing protein [Methanoculleus sp.]